MNKVHFSSATYEWDTPQDLFDELNRRYGPFDLDVCATSQNAKCERFFSKEEDGLKMDWALYGSRIWMNPPYGRDIWRWVQKAAAVGLYEKDCTVVCLLPARTDTRWFHNYCLSYGRIEFIKGRLKFGGSKNSAPFPSMVTIFR